ncbi:hypothetical protein KIPB_016222, partial [Kipferlia bialata]|eukprot:g16222.t1
MDQYDVPLPSREFGQQVKLVHSLRRILKDYPQGPQILLELLQNADDARATEYCVYLDRCKYGTGNILQ